jgi:hypothetical protein
MTGSPLYTTICVFCYPKMVIIPACCLSLYLLTLPVCLRPIPYGCTDTLLYSFNMAPKTSPSKAGTSSPPAMAVTVKNPYIKTPLAKKKTSVTPKKAKKLAGAPTLTVTAFSNPFRCEAYVYSSKSGSDGYLYEVQCALAGIRSDGTVVPPDPVLVEGNFHSTVYRRLPNTKNEHALNGNGFWRQMVLRYPPEGESTSKTRQEGLSLLSTFLKDPLHTRYPPTIITLIDETDVDNVPSLDHYFFDDTIQEIMIEDLDETILNGNFFNEYSDFALKCWAYPFVSNWAVSLGFHQP